MNGACVLTRARNRPLEEGKEGGSLGPNPNKCILKSVACYKID